MSYASYDTLMIKLTLFETSLFCYWRFLISQHFIFSVNTHVKRDVIFNHITHVDQNMTQEIYLSKKQVIDIVSDLDSSC